MNQEQLREVLRDFRQPPTGKKLEKLEETTGSSWQSFRQHFVTTALINGWEDQRQRRELKAAMHGEASRLTSDIDIDVPGRNIAATLDLYESRFLPAAGAQAARVEFHAALQRPDENVVQYHGRVRELFSRAYPGEVAQDSVLCIQTYALGLADMEVSRYVLDQNPDTYSRASELAQVKGATEAALRARGRSKGATGGSINQLGDESVNWLNNGGRGGDKKNKETRKCWICGTVGHIKEDCPKKKNDKKKSNKKNNKGARGVNELRAPETDKNNNVSNSNSNSSSSPATPAVSGN